MKKDIYIPTPKGLHLAFVQLEDVWDMYLINQNYHSIKNILITTEASTEGVKSSTLRYFLESLDEISFIKFESIVEPVLLLDNVAFISYYVGIDLFDITFHFNLKTLIESGEIDLPLIEKKGFLI